MRDNEEDVRSLRVDVYEVCGRKYEGRRLKNVYRSVKFT